MGDLHYRDTSRKLEKSKWWKSGKSDNVSMLINPKHMFLRINKALITASHTHMEILAFLCTYRQKDGLLFYKDVISSPLWRVGGTLLTELETSLSSILS